MRASVHPARPAPNALALGIALEIAGAPACWSCPVELMPRGRGGSLDITAAVRTAMTPSAFTGTAFRVFRESEARGQRHPVPMHTGNRQLRVDVRDRDFTNALPPPSARVERLRLKSDPGPHAPMDSDEARPPLAWSQAQRKCDAGGHCAWMREGRQADTARREGGLVLLLRCCVVSCPFTCAV